MGAAFFDSVTSIPDGRSRIVKEFEWVANKKLISGDFPVKLIIGLERV